MVEKKSVGIIVVLVLSLILLSVFSAADVTEETDCIYYFTSAGCPECQPTTDFMEKLQAKYPPLQVKTFEVYYNRGEAGTLELYYNAYGVPEKSRAIPAVFIGESYLVGTEAIEKLLPERILEHSGDTCPARTENSLGLVSETKSTPNVMETINFFSVTADGFIHSIDPTMLAVFLVLLALLLGLKDDQLVVRRGALFIGVVFVLFLLSSINLLEGFRESASFFFYKTVGFVSILTGLLYIRAFMKTWDVLLQGIPEGTRLMGKRIRNVLQSSGGFITFAILSALFSMSSTTNTETLFQNLYASGLQGPIFPLMLYYTLLTIVPLIVMTVILYIAHTELEEKAVEKALSDSKLARLRTHYHYLLNFGISTVMIVKGLLLLFM